MKKQTNISLLKELVNNNVLERVKLRRYGVQAYNIAEGEEYTVITKYAKQGGRYYFIDRDGRRFLASHYDRAEFVAGEMLEIIAEERAAAMHAADQVEASGSVLVCASLLDLFFEECDRRNIKVASSETCVDDLARMLTRYDLVKDAETAQQEDNESDDNDTQSDDAQSDDAQSDDNNEGEQTAAEPLRLAQKVAKVAESVKAYAAKARALRPALVLYVWGLIIAALFALCLLSLPFVCLLVPYIFITAPTFKPTDFIIIAALEAVFIAAGVAMWQLFRNGDLYSSWHDCKILTRPF